MRLVRLSAPAQLIIGEGSLGQFFQDIKNSKKQRLFIISIKEVRPIIQKYLDAFKDASIAHIINEEISAEPTFAEADNIVLQARIFNADAVIGIGGGSVLDTAKYVAAQIENDQTYQEVIGIGNLQQRSTYIVCLPTTAGTGSEVSPNAIFLDTTDNEKKACVSPHLMPDASYVDPLLTVGVPPHITAFTGIDAFTHCLEAYLNLNAHPVVDEYAIMGMKNIFFNLKKCYDNGNNIEARTAVAIGSVYGGMCLGPVNTAAVHALAYPLGSKYKIAHGLSNALLLPYVLAFNLPASTTKLAQLATHFGLKDCGLEEDNAKACVESITELITSLNIPLKLSELGIKETDLEDLATSGMKVQRLLQNNPREVSYQDALSIYRQAF